MSHCLTFIIARHEAVIKYILRFVRKKFLNMMILGRGWILDNYVPSLQFFIVHTHIYIIN